MNLKILIYDIILIMEKYYIYKDYKSNKKKNEITICKYNDYHTLIEYDFKVKELKNIIKELKLPICRSKKKHGIKLFCINTMYLSMYIIKIQKCWKNYFIRLFNKTLGPAYKTPSISNNIDDFLTTENIENIDYYNFFSFKDVDHFVYSFNIVSFYKLISKKRSPINPYNRMVISENHLTLFKKRLKYNKILNKMDIFVEYQPKTLTITERIENVFHKMDELGNYTNASWLKELSLDNVYKFIYELVEIWSYRAQLTQETKIIICPPYGNPFRELPRQFMSHGNRFNTPYYNYNSLMSFAVKIMEKLVYSANHDTDKALGAIYILSALTLVSENARDSLPWLYASVYYN